MNVSQEVLGILEGMKDAEMEALVDRSGIRETFAMISAEVSLFDGFEVGPVGGWEEPFRFKCVTLPINIMNKEYLLKAKISKERAFMELLVGHEHGGFPVFTVGGDLSGLLSFKIEVVKTYVRKFGEKVRDFVAAADKLHAL